jgi:hypothetical protein
MDSAPSLKKEDVDTDSQWLKSIGFVENTNKDYVLAGWLVITCEHGKWSAYSVKSSHWHYLCGVDLREDVPDRNDIQTEHIRRLRQLIEGVIRRCEPQGYVGMDGQFLKVLKEAIKNEN